MQMMGQILPVSLVLLLNQHLVFGFNIVFLIQFKVLEIHERKNILVIYLILINFKPNKGIPKFVASPVRAESWVQQLLVLAT